MGVVGANLHNHLLSAQKAVGDELASSDGHWLVGHVCEIERKEVVVDAALKILAVGKV